MNPFYVLALGMASTSVKIHLGERWGFDWSFYPLVPVAIAIVHFWGAR